MQPQIPIHLEWKNEVVSPLRYALDRRKHLMYFGCMKYQILGEKTEQIREIGAMGEMEENKHSRFPHGAMEKKIRNK